MFFTRKKVSIFESINKSQLTTDKSSLNLNEWTIKWKAFKHFRMVKWSVSLVAPCGFCTFLSLSLARLSLFLRETRESIILLWVGFYCATSKSYVIWCQFFDFPKNNHNHSNTNTNAIARTNNWLNRRRKKGEKRKKAKEKQTKPTASQRTNCLVFICAIKSVQ